MHIFNYLNNFAFTDFILSVVSNETLEIENRTMNKILFLTKLVILFRMHWLTKVTAYESKTYIQKCFAHELPTKVQKAFSKYYQVARIIGIRKC